MGVITFDGLHDHNGKADVAVILGTKVHPDGEMSSFLKGRVDAAFNLYQQGNVRYIMVSGGIGFEGQDEAKVMAAYLEKNGVPVDTIIIYNQGVNTKATAQNLKKIMVERHFQSAYIVSQFFHIPRIRLAFSCIGINAPYSAHSNTVSIRDIYSTLREVPAYALYWWQC